MAPPGDRRTDCARDQLWPLVGCAPTNRYIRTANPSTNADRIPKPCVAGSNPAGGTVHEWPLLPPPAPTAPSQLSVSHSGCPRHAGLYCSLMHANCTTTVPSWQTPAASVARRTGACRPADSRAEPWPPGFSTLERNPGPAAAATSKLAEGDQGTRGPFGHSSVTTTLGVVGPQKPEHPRTRYQRVRGSSP